MAELKFKVGDIVRFRSGGLSMTVERIRYENNLPSGFVELIWQDRNGGKQEVTTHQNTLELALPEHPYGR